MPFYQSLAAAGFESLWYWVLHLVVWTMACYRTLGVPLDMLLRARREPVAAERVDLLARLTVARIVGIYDRAGPAIAAVSGFLLACLAGFGFGSGIEAAQAAFAIALPFAGIAYSKLRLALFLSRRRISGPRLVLMLARRRMWHQMIALLAILGAAAVALNIRPPMP